MIIFKKIYNVMKILKLQENFKLVCWIKLFAGNEGEVMMGGVPSPDVLQSEKETKMKRKDNLSAFFWRKKDEKNFNALSR
jgi:hypothetical protein